MKRQLKKIILGAAVLVFVISGVSFAHDWGHRPPGKAYGHYKVKKHRYGWHKKHYKPRRHHRGYVYKEVHHHHHHGKHERHWRDRHYKPRRHHRDRYIYKEVHHHDHDYKKHRRRSHRGDDGPKVVFKLVLKGNEIF